MAKSISAGVGRSIRSRNTARFTRATLETRKTIRIRSNWRKSAQELLHEKKAGDRAQSPHIAKLSTTARFRH